MEDTLGGSFVEGERNVVCLNPCFNGRYSRSAKSVKNLKVKGVLILVLMEDTLGELLLLVLL